MLQATACQIGVGGGSMLALGSFRRTEDAACSQLRDRKVRTATFKVPDGDKKPAPGELIHSIHYMPVGYEAQNEASEHVQEFVQEALAHQWCVC